MKEITSFFPGDGRRVYEIYTKKYGTIERSKHGNLFSFVAEDGKSYEPHEITTFMEPMCQFEDSIREDERKKCKS